MDLSLLPRNFKCSSPSQLRFVKQSSIKEICNRYNLYVTNYQTSSIVIDARDCLKQILNILQSKALVTSYIEEGSEVELYCLIDEVGTIADAQPTDKKENRLTRTLDEDRRAAIQSIADSHRRYVELISSSLRRNFDFDLSFEEFSSLYNKETCYYTNKEIAVGTQGPDSLTFDRIDATKGYVSGNVVVCSHRANQLKNELYESENALFGSLEDLKLFTDRIYASTGRSTLSDLLIN